MPTFEITSPTGTKYRVTAPEGASQEEVMARVKAQSVADDMTTKYPKGSPQEAAAALSRQRGDLGAIGNIPKSAGQFVENLVQPIVHPIDTAESLYNIGRGVLQKTGILSGKDAEPHAEAVGKFLKDRYGSLEAIRKTAKEDPVGLAADVSMVLTLGGSAAARAPGMAGEIARGASAAGAAIDPLRPVAATLKGAGNVAAEAAGLTTGAGSEAIKTAARAGAAGGDTAKAFRENLTGAAPIEQVVTEAKAAVGQLRQERGEVYRKSMADIGADTTVLDFDKIDKALTKVEGIQTYKGQDLSPSTAKIRDTIRDTVEHWRGLPAGDFHTPEGLDALKKKIGDIRDATQYGTPERVVADGVYRSIRQTIVDQAPEYGKAMKGYEEASDLIREIESTLSTKPNANIDTTLRKLQSVLRNNVSTNYGRRAELVDFLQRAGAKNLLEKIAGQTLSSSAPRGLGRVLAGGEGISALGALAAGQPGVALALGGGLAASSPLLAGGAAYGLGASTRLPLRTLGRSSFQAGRLSNQ